MYEELLKMRIILEIRHLVDNLEEEDQEELQDSYTAFMKEMILNTYSAN